MEYHKELIALIVFTIPIISLLIFLAIQSTRNFQAIKNKYGNVKRG
jgi:hypothetical protein